MTWVRWLLRVALAASALAAASLNPALATGGQPGSPARQILVMVRHPADHYRATGAYGGSYADELGRSARERLARSSARRDRLALVDNWAMPMIGVDCFVMKVPEGQSTEAKARQISADADVAWAEPVELYGARSAAASHNDPLYPVQPAATVWHLADLHRMADGRGERIAVVDSGIDAGHPDLSRQLLLNRNFGARQPFIPRREP